MRMKPPLPPNRCVPKGIHGVASLPLFLDPIAGRGANKPLATAHRSLIGYWHTRLLRPLP
ncbi:hypothetical protein NB231_04970 [Nitrococcus mobilis Nb-231]|uniref:Uncharacterized protein n=1 Tax=Nitrococcus mobilis Nb-231 TaxID=314278 RepID=A4BQ78_9GAMM|nr:hypothetical protein NB231_04970 [Nitrococcus mobilis Nb-231]